jgi:hypothetical protein
MYAKHVAKVGLACALVHDFFFMSSNRESARHSPRPHLANIVGREDRLVLVVVFF